MIVIILIETEFACLIF